MSNIKQYLCQSYYDDDDVLQDCECGKCEATTDKSLVSKSNPKGFVTQIETTLEIEL